MRHRPEAAQIVVVNHHLFFADLALKKGGGFGGAIPPYDAVVFDEAHQIENVATDFFGVRVTSSRIDRLLRMREFKPSVAASPWRGGDARAAG